MAKDPRAPAPAKSGTDADDAHITTALQLLADAQAALLACRRATPGAGPNAAAAVPSLAHLSPAEREVLKLIGEGKENRDIAALLHKSVKTIETHRSHAKEKLGVKNTTEFVQLAWQLANESRLKPSGKKAA